MPAKPRPDEATRRRPDQASWRLSNVGQLTREDDVRVSRAFSRLLRLDGIWVRQVQFFTDRVVVRVALRRRRLRCPLCEFSTPHRHNRQSVESTWRHLDLGVWRLELRAQLRRLRCPEHGVRVEEVPFARHRSGFTRDFEQLVAWLAITMDKSAITRLLRIDWDTVGRIIARVCAEDLDPDRLENLFEIGIETVSSYCTSGNGFLRSCLDSGGVGDAVAAGGLDLGVDGDRELALAGAPCVELALVDPAVDDGVADVEALGEVVHADLAVWQLRRGGDAVLPAHPADAVFGEWAA
jgi:hypothetical protein